MKLKKYQTIELVVDKGFDETLSKKAKLSLTYMQTVLVLNIGEFRHIPIIFNKQNVCKILFKIIKYSRNI